MRASSHLLSLSAVFLALGLGFAAPEAARGEEAAVEAEAPPMPSPEEALDKAAFMARVGGKVVVYLDAAGRPYGEEYFDPKGGEVVWRYLDGSCQTARWTAAGSLFCFAYPDSTSCWRVRPGEEWTAHLVTPVEDQGHWVRFAEIRSGELTCKPDMVSMLRR